MPKTAVTAPSGLKAVDKETTAGVLFGFGAYGLWGLLPLYFFALMPAGAVEIVANRVVWSLLFCILLITVTRSWRALARAFRDRSVFGSLALAAALIAVNWLTYTYGVTTGQAVEAALGYFINPLVSVLLGVFVLKEKLRPLQWAAVGIGFVAVAVLTVSYGKLPWIALTLAFSFGLYGFVKKRVGPKVDAVTSLSLETIVLAPIAAATMVFLGVSGSATLASQGPGHFWLLAASGVITAVPLLFFGASARRLPMTTIGLLQYVAPLLQFIVALVVFQEAMTTSRWIGFGVVWLALLLLTVDMLRATRKNSLARKRARTS
ncbi:EamA family transporter RarD [Pseudarthrobacter sp. AL07]|uniref:EamA family transporter RarD n=1 Tax=unclassified Pseudarthrobacter TaxID=2647000 RepID=UPI00249CE2BA|nr:MULTISPECIES: EamA family transporter RarD [unclassified Pseudarthrobacter]MDI3193616.1 EamA family transporter RarD [Pseudarthrobacter sp. AL20]MDI3207874.1 EamA family transporter RarD [Pseudarthrobacter sp. AL07]